MMSFFYLLHLGNILKKVYCEHDAGNCITVQVCSALNTYLLNDKACSSVNTTHEYQLMCLLQRIHFKRIWLSALRMEEYQVMLIINQILDTLGLFFSTLLVWQSSYSISYFSFLLFISFIKVNCFQNQRFDIFYCYKSKYHINLHLQLFNQGVVISVPLVISGYQMISISKILPIIYFKVDNVLSSSSKV